MFEGQNTKSDVGLWSLKNRNPKSDVRSLSGVQKLSEVAYVWSRPTTYVCSKPEVQNLSLKPKSLVSKKSKAEVQTPKSEVWCPKSFWNLPKVCLNSYMWSSKSKIRSLSEVWNQKSVWSPFEVWIPKSVRSPKYYAQSLSEVWPLKTEIWNLKLQPKFKMVEKNA